VAWRNILGLNAVEARLVARVVHGDRQRDVEVVALHHDQLAVGIGEASQQELRDEVMPPESGHEAIVPLPRKRAGSPRSRRIGAVVATEVALCQLLGRCQQ
jgi:hypothetical protein